VDKTEYFPWKMLYYTRSGVLHKEMVVHDVIRTKGKAIVSKLTLSDKLRRDSSTEFEITKVEIDVPLPAGIFSKQRLSR
jgi:hypothetical protein